LIKRLIGYANIRQYDKTAQPSGAFIIVEYQNIFYNMQIRSVRLKEYDKTPEPAGSAIMENE
jgi:hypothetical protein